MIKTVIKTKFKSIIAGMLAAILIATGPIIAVAKPGNGNNNAHDRVTICHATGSTTNPFVRITPNVNGIISGHQNHQDLRDIIPPFTYNSHGTTKSFSGQNWDANGQAIFNNNCEPVGGQGGGPGGGPSGGQVLGASVSAGVAAQAPQGAVNAGFGGANAFSLTSLQRTL